MNTLQKFGYASLATFFMVNQALAAGTASSTFGESRAAGLVGGSATGVQGIFNLISSVLTFVTVIAVIYILWAGFQILTAGGDEEKVKKGRQTIIYVVIGIVVMWLAYTIVTTLMSYLQ